MQPKAAMRRVAMCFRGMIGENNYSKLIIIKKFFPSLIN